MSTVTLPAKTLDPLTGRAEKSAAQAEVIRGCILAFFFFTAARLGICTPMDAPLVAIVSAVLFPEWRPALLLMVISIQDAPGQVLYFDYVGVAGIAGLMLVSAILQRQREAMTQEIIQFRSLLRFALLIIIYGVFNSAVQHRFGYHEQSSSRPFPIIGALMCMNAITAYFAFREVKETPLSDTRIRTAIICILLHIFVIAGLQLVLGPMFGASPRGVIEMKELFSMMHAQGGRSFARLTGPFLSPNLMASVPGLLMLMHLRFQRTREISIEFICAFFIVGMTAAILGGARTMFVFYMAGTAAMTWTRSPKHTLLAGVSCLPMLVIVNIPWSELLSIMRLKDLHSLGVRGELWQASLHMMDFNDWMWGFGLTHFPVFCQNHLGYYGSDPHNWILSAAGMFGIFGLLFYGALIRHLIKGMVTTNVKHKAICTCLFLYFIGREFGNTQYVLNNSPMCCLYWFAIALIFVRQETDLTADHEIALRLHNDEHLASMLQKAR